MEALLVRAFCATKSQTKYKALSIKKKEKMIGLPHLHGCYKFDKPEVIKASEFTDLPVYAMSDNSALKVINNEPPVILGTDCVVAQNGKIIEEKN